MSAFRVVTVAGAEVLVNDGPADAAAGTITGDSAAALWTRQVLSDGRLRAVVLDATTEEFFEIHRTAEHVAAALGLSAVDVAVWPAHAVYVTDAGSADPTTLPGDDTLLLAGGTAPSPGTVRLAATLAATS